jgi:MtrB/PioB family decaheme-associated outer membrane protein
MRTLSRAVALALLAPAAAWAQVDTSDWECEYCPFEEGYRADYEVGAKYVSEDALRFGNGTGLDEKAAFADVSGSGTYAKDGKQLRWYAEDLGLKSRVLSVAGGKQGTFDLSLKYSEIPYRRFDSTQTVFTPSGDTLGLPSGWVTGSLTSGFTQLGSSLASRDIESDRQNLEVGGRYLPTSNFSVFADYRRQKRDGVAMTSGSMFAQAAYLPRPIDDYTDEVDAGIGYESDAFNLKLAFYGSFYRNSLTSLTWDNPYAAFNSALQGRTAVEPDNDFQQVSLSGGYRAAPMNTTIVFSVAMGQGEQTAQLLPYTINSTLTSGSLPVSALDGKVDTTNFAFTVTSRPFDKARVKLSYRQDERDNQTPVSMWSRVITDNLTSGASEGNVPYSFDRRRLALSGSYRLFSTLHLSGGYDRTELDRDYQEVAEQTEDAGWGKLRWRPNAWIDVAIRGGAEKRDIDRYDETVAVNLGQNPLMRKYNLAYRYRSFGELTASASLPQTPISAAITYLYADDEYTRSQLGMTESREDRFAADLSWSVSENASVYVTGGTENIEANQLGSQNFAAADWRANHEDSFYHAGGGFRVMSIGEKADLEFAYTRSEGETEITFVQTSGSPTGLPRLESAMDSLRLSLRYPFSEKLDGTLHLQWERFETKDWALDGVLPDTLPTVLTMGASAYDYDLWAIGIGVRYKIDSGTE